MTDEAPVILTAEKDGDGPARRRRRPALSCVECRSRKVRCDREKPCGACIRVKSMTCTYRPQRAGFRSGSPVATTASVSGGNDQDQRYSVRSSPQPPRTSNELDSLVNKYIAPGILGEHGTLTLGPLRADRASFNLNSRKTSGDSVLIEGLLQRIRRLESGSAGERDPSANAKLPIRQDGETGQFVKSKFYGPSHWMNAMDPYEALGQENITVNHNTNRTEVNKKTELYSSVARVKQMARIIKASRLSQPSITQEVQESLPTKEICDVLVACYLRTFESVFRVLHIPSFRKEYNSYWTGEIPRKPSVILKILLVCAIGVPFYDGPDKALLRNASMKWTEAATHWLSGPHVKSKLNMAGLQIQILAIIARQLISIDGDHVWIPAGSLLRSAMILGLHRDPAHFGKISLYHREMRRRLWATILEITAQSSLDMGMPPMISPNDYDTKAPSNIDDEDIEEGRDVPLDEKPPTEYTDSSIQIAFTETLPIRLEIIKRINNLRFELSYDDVLRIGSELNDACRSQTIFFKSALNAGHKITPFQIKMADSLVRRFVLCLHRPYFAKAKENPQFYYSRKMCLDTSLAIYAPATEPVLGQQDDWTKMTCGCVGFFKSFFLYAMSTVYLELISQIDEQKQASAICTPLITSCTPQSNALFTLPTQFQTLRSVLVSAHGTATARIRNGETNAKGAVFMSCAIARIDALVSGVDAERAVLDAAKKSVLETSQILTEVYQAEHGAPIDLTAANAEKETGRGDGADDTTGQSMQTGTDVAVEVTLPDEDSYLDADGTTLDQSLDRDMLDARMGMTDDGMGELNSSFSLDTYMEGQTRDPMSYSNHFSRSPEWFYDMNGYAGQGNWGSAFGEI
ncbi:hypothetical protein DE146DRAFT_461267 [Phaeosphaeria sp. MPI-PUGE-AT-0046c]|nr:hypothetical protein DE146DRAFT_461267 [Phaeosphaeria sp. MPI-PUGE-AT-0046c]